MWHKVRSLERLQKMEFDISSDWWVWMSDKFTMGALMDASFAASLI